MLRDVNFSSVVAIQGGTAPTQSPKSSSAAQCCPVVEAKGAHDEGSAGPQNDATQTAGEAKLGFSDESPSSLDAKIHASQLRTIEAEKDLPRRADLVLHYKFRGLCEKSRQLILSVDAVSVTGCAVQDYLRTPASVKPPILANEVRKLHQQLVAEHLARAPRKGLRMTPAEAMRREMKLLVAKLASTSVSC